MTERETKNLWACINSLLDAKVIDAAKAEELARRFGLLGA